MTMWAGALEEPFTREMLRSRGVDPSLVRRSEFCQVIRSVWIRRDAMDDDTRIRAALALHPDDAVASHFSAARLLDLPVPEHHLEHVTVFRPEDRHWRPEVKPHVTKRERTVVLVRGIRTTDAITTFIQLAGALPLVDLVVLGDAIVKKYKVAPRRLVSACRESGDYYSKRALQAALYVRRGVDSPMESRLRMLLVLAGLPEPKVDVREMNEDGTWRRRYDLCYPEFRLIIEYDGRQHATDVSQWETDLDRREELDDDGYRILVVTAKGIFVEPERTIDRVRRQLIARGCSAKLDVDDRWREHFRV
jgi:very-short-patch-repair endonuclease